MPITTTALTPSAFSDGPRVVEKCRGTAHPEGHPARRPAQDPVRPAGRRRRASRERITGY